MANDQWPIPAHFALDGDFKGVQLLPLLKITGFLDFLMKKSEFWDTDICPHPKIRESTTNSTNDTNVDMRIFRQNIS